MKRQFYTRRGKSVQICCKTWMMYFSSPITIFYFQTIRPYCIRVDGTIRRYFQHAHFIPIVIVGVGKRGAYELVHSDLPRQHSFGTTLRFTGPVTADCRQ